MISFDPTCCGAAHRVQENHDFVPIGLATYDGLTDSDDPAKPNMTIPVLTMKTIMESYEHNKIDVLRLDQPSIDRDALLAKLLAQWEPHLGSAALLGHLIDRHR